MFHISGMLCRFWNLGKILFPKCDPEVLSFLWFNKYVMLILHAHAGYMLKNGKYDSNSQHICFVPCLKVRSNHQHWGVYSVLIIKLLYFHVLKKTFFPFMINIVELNYIESLTPWFRIQKTRMSSKGNDTRYSVFLRI